MMSMVNPEVDVEGGGVERERVVPAKWSLVNGRVQVLVVSVIAFCCPGIFNALNGLGGAGSGDINTVSFVNFCLYACFAVFGYAGGLFFNFFGPKVLLAGGGSTYAIYALFAYLSGTQPQWATIMWIFCGALLGIGAAFFWTAQGSMMMSYAPHLKRGQYISMFWVIFNLGGLVGGILLFALNFDNSEGTTANPVSYFVFVGLMAIGSVLALVLILSPDRVIREDGEPVEMERCKSFKEELSDVSKVILDKNMLRLFLLFLSSNWFYTYVFNSVNGTLFNIRTRGLNSAFFWGAQMVGSVVFGKIVDTGKESRTDFKRGIAGYLFVLGTTTVSWGLGIYLQYGYRGGYGNGTPIELIDFTQVAWIYPLITYIGYGIADSIIQTFSYWIMSTIACGDTVLSARYSGYYKGVQSAGAAVAWLLDSQYIHLPARVQLWICVGLFFASMIPTLFVILDLNRVPPNDSDDFEEVNIHSQQQKDNVNNHGPAALDTI